MPTFIGIPEIDRLLESARETRNRHGNRTREIFYNADRYLFDFRLDLQVWAALDTDSDAAYFGLWAAKSLRSFLIYAEGDLRFTQADDDESYDRELAAHCEFHGPSPYMMTLDDHGEAAAYYQDRSELFLDPTRAPKNERGEGES